MKKSLCPGLLTIGVAFSAVALSGCNARPPRELHLIELPDLSASIEPRAQMAALKAMIDPTAGMQRGDSITVIPIVGDAGDDIQGRILHWKLPATQEPFDGDLLRI